MKSLQYLTDKEKGELTVKELALFLPRLPCGAHILFYGAMIDNCRSEKYRHLGDMAPKLFVEQYSKERFLKYRGVGPLTIEILSAGFKAVGVEWK